MIDTIPVQTKMDEKAKLILTELDHITPINIQQKTSASIDMRDSFHTLWHRHSAQAARYFLLAQIYNGKVTLEHESSSND